MTSHQQSPESFFYKDTNVPCGDQELRITALIKAMRRDGIDPVAEPREALAMVEDRFKSTLAKLAVTHHDHWLVDEIRKDLARIPQIRKEL